MGKTMTPLPAITVTALLVAAIGFTVGEPQQDHPREIVTMREHLEAKTIVIDPGHGGADDGAVGQNGTLEKEATLETAIRIQHELAGRTRATVVLTRERDEEISLDDRVNAAHQTSADLFVSIHYDAYTDRDVQGITTYFYGDEDARLAAVMHEQLLGHHMNTEDRGVAVGDYFVLRENLSPAVLLELGYISNPEDEGRINSREYQDKVAEAVVNGIIKYFEETPSPAGSR